MSDGNADGGGRRVRKTRFTGRGLLGTIADVIAVLTAFAAGVSLVRGAPTPQAVLAIALSLLALSFMALSFVLQRQLAEDVRAEKKKARHADSLSYMAEAATALRTGATNLERGDHPSTFNQPASEAASKFSNAMSAATGVSCRVVVKSVYAPGGRDDVAVRTLVSSQTSDGRPKKDSVDWVRDNTDFEEIVYNGKEYFLSNDLSAEKVYKNSHWTKESLENGYPYLSTIVWPIAGLDGDDWIVKGFLCVDTPDRNSFVLEQDIAVGRTLAAMWYLALERYEEASEILEEIEGEAVTPSMQGGQ